MTQTAIVAPARRDLDGIVSRLTMWLSTRLPSAQELVIRDLGYPSGAGLSNETILFEASWRSPKGSKTEGYVLRLAPTSYCVYMEVDFEVQFNLQRALADRGVPVPRVLWFETDPSLFGAPFFVMQRLRGRVPVSFPPYSTHGWIAETDSASRAVIWRNAVIALARLDSVPSESIAMLNKPQWGKTGWDQEWHYWIESHRWARAERHLPTCDGALDWLRKHMPSERNSGLCWGDARIGNMMFDANYQVLAIMDWEGASLGGALQDLGYWLVLSDVMATATGVHPPGFGSREETIELWEQVTQKSACDVAWYEVFAAFKLASHVARKLTLDGNSRPGFNYEDNGATRYLAQKLALPPPSAVI